MNGEGAGEGEGGGPGRQGRREIENVENCLKKGWGRGKSEGM